MESLEENKSLKQSNVANKFRAYRLGAESTKSKLKDAEKIIEELKNEIKFSRDTEKDLRSQISTTQNRLIFLQQTLKKFINVSERQQQNEKISQRIQEKIQEFEEKINQIRQKIQNLLKSAIRNEDLVKKMKELESILEVKNSECDFMKMEIQTLAKEKKNIEDELQEKCKNLENSLENSQKKENETQIHFRETLQYYKQQIEDYERKIKCYENERRCFLEDFEPSKPLENHEFTWTDSTVGITAEQRSPKTPTCEKINKTQTESNKPETQLFHCSPFIGKPKHLNHKKTQNFSKKQKPQLEFLTQDSSVTPNSENNSRKRRLFSTNLNHYIE